MTYSHTVLHPAIPYFSDIQPHRASPKPSHPLLQWHTATPCFIQPSPTPVTYSHTVLHPSHPLLQWRTATPCFTQTIPYFSDVQPRRASPKPSPTSVTYRHTVLHPNPAIPYFSDIQPHRASPKPSHPLLQWHTGTPCFTQTQLSPTSVTYSHTVLHPNPAIPYFSDIQSHRASPKPSPTSVTYSHAVLHPIHPLLQWHTATPCFTQTQPSPTLSCFHFRGRGPRVGLWEEDLESKRHYLCIISLLPRHSDVQ